MTGKGYLYTRSMLFGNAYDFAITRCDTIDHSLLWELSLKIVRDTCKEQENLKTGVRHAIRQKA